MALQTSGQITFNDIQNELGGTNPISLSEYYGIGTLPTSGTIRISDFYGEPKFYNSATKTSLMFSGSMLTNNPGVAPTNRKKCTLSYWAKFTKNRQYYPDYMVVMGNSSQNYTTTGLDTDDTLFFAHYQSGEYRLKTTAKFKDQSAWYHVVVQVDTTQSTASNRVKIYVNNVEQTLTGSYPNQNQDLYWRQNGASTNIGGFAYAGYARAFSGYLTNVEFADGYNYAPSTFGEDKNGVWIPKNWAWNNTNMGNTGFSLYIYEPGEGQISGTTFYDDGYHGFSFTCTTTNAGGLVPTYDSLSYDHPENNFCVMNPNAPNAGITESYGNLRTSGSSVWKPLGATFAYNSGKYYWEAIPNSALSVNTYYHALGATVMDNPYYDYDGHIGDNNHGGHGHAIMCYTGTAYYWHNNSAVSSLSISVAQNDVYQCAIDADAGKGWLGVKNSWIGGGSPSSGTSPTFTFTPGKWVVPHISHYGSSVMKQNFGQNSSFTGTKTRQYNTDSNGNGDFYYTPPTNFLALCSANLEVGNAVDLPLGNSPQDHFNTVLWTGNGSYPRTITGVGFQPDLVWSKARSTGGDHLLYDVIRGTGTSKCLSSSSNGVEGYFSSYSNLTAFAADGFTVGTTSSGNAWNNSGTNYVAWNWKGNGSGTTNTSGSVTSTVSANQDAGFSIVTYTGTGSNLTVGHGLTQAPNMVIIKGRNFQDWWWVGHDDIGSGWTGSDYITLSGQYAAGWDGNRNTWTGAPTSSVVQIGTDNIINRSGGNCVMYCFHEVPGYSRFGSYTGNSSTDGTFVYTGFRPAYVLTRKISGDFWPIYDDARDPQNVMTHVVYADLSNTEYNGSTVGIEFHSNGFKPVVNWSATNQSGYDYIYMAFAEQPFKYANAR